MILVIYTQALIQQSAYVYEDMIYLVEFSTMLEPYTFIFFPESVFPMWAKQSSSVNCYKSNGVTTMFTINCGLL